MKILLKVKVHVLAALWVGFSLQPSRNKTCTWGKRQVNLGTGASEEEESQTQLSGDQCGGRSPPAQPQLGQPSPCARVQPNHRALLRLHLISIRQMEGDEEVYTQGLHTRGAHPSHTVHSSWLRASQPTPQHEHENGAVCLKRIKYVQGRILKTVKSVQADSRHLMP